MNSDPLHPGSTLLAKVGSIVRHAEEAISDNAHPFDAQAVESLLSDQEVSTWLSAMDSLGLLPVKRDA